MCKHSCLRSATGSRVFLLTLLMGALVIVGVANFVLVKVLFVAFKSNNAPTPAPGNASGATTLPPAGNWSSTLAALATTAAAAMTTGAAGGANATSGGKYSFFVNQGINLFYLFVGGAMVYPRMCFSNDITPAMKKVPHKIYVIMAALDAFGTFFISMGAVYTPGQIQPLLNQALIPLTMVFSFFMLRARYNIWELLGAVLMLGGAAVSIVPTITDTGSQNSRWYACVIYFCSNIPMAASGVYKEMAFRQQPMDVWYLSQWVAIYQFLISFVFVPLLLLPFIGGTETGMTWGEMWAGLRDGCLCWLQLLPDCAGADYRGQTWLLPVYTLVNMFYTALGLFVTKHGSAVLSRLAYALILPLTAAAFALPFMGPYKETITVYTLIGLGITFAGFGLYQWAVEVFRKKQEARKKAAAGEVAEDDEDDGAESDAAKMLRDPLMDGE